MINLILTGALVCLLMWVAINTVQVIVNLSDGYYKTKKGFVSKLNPFWPIIDAISSYKQLK